MVETVKRCEPDADRVPEAAERGGMCGAFFNLLEIGVRVAGILEKVQKRKTQEFACTAKSKVQYLLT